MPSGENKPVDINIDGEEMIFTKFAKYEVVPKCLDIMVDFDKIIKFGNYKQAKNMKWKNVIKN